MLDLLLHEEFTCFWHEMNCYSVHTQCQILKNMNNMILKVKGRVKAIPSTNTISIGSIRFLSNERPKKNSCHGHRKNHSFCPPTIRLANQNKQSQIFTKFQYPKLLRAYVPRILHFTSL